MATKNQKKDAVKEGGKKGQDLIGMCDMGGIKHFHVAMESCNGNWDLLQMCLDAANKPVDEKGDDRKGGAGDIGKVFFSAGTDSLIFIVNLPAAAASDKINLKEWAEHLCKSIGAEIVEEKDEVIRCEAKADTENNKFPLKMRDTAIAAGFDFLRGKGLVMDNDSDDDIDYGALAEAAGVEW